MLACRGWRSWSSPGGGLSPDFGSHAREAFVAVRSSTCVVPQGSARVMRWPCVVIVRVVAGASIPGGRTSGQDVAAVATQARADDADVDVEDRRRTPARIPWGHPPGRRPACPRSGVAIRHHTDGIHEAVHQVGNGRVEDLVSRSAIERELSMREEQVDLVDPALRSASSTSIVDVVGTSSRLHRPVEAGRTRREQGDESHGRQPQRSPQRSGSTHFIALHVQFLSSFAALSTTAVPPARARGLGLQTTVRQRESAAILARW